MAPAYLLRDAEFSAPLLNRFYARFELPQADYDTEFNRQEEHMTSDSVTMHDYIVAALLTLRVAMDRSCLQGLFKCRICELPLPDSVAVQQYCINDETCCNCVQITKRTADVKAAMAAFKDAEPNTPSSNAKATALVALKSTDRSTANVRIVVGCVSTEPLFVGACVA